MIQTMWIIISYKQVRNKFKNNSLCLIFHNFWLLTASETVLDRRNENLEDESRIVSKKRKQNKHTWVKNVRKIKKLRGETYTSLGES